jgi:hypothetical protein
MSRFSFRAGAAAAGGVFTRPFNEPLRVQAASFLTPAGGYGSARVEHFRYHEILSFKAGYTQVMGTRRTDNGVGVFDTLASAVIEDLNILGIITADRIVARLTSQARSDARSPEMVASPFGSYFENLRVAGQPIGASCHARLFDDKYSTKSAIAAAKIPAALGPDASEVRPSAAAPSRDDTLRFSIFDPLDSAISGAQTFAGCRLAVPSLGDIFLGEFIVTGAHRQLTMLRVELHSPEEGEVVLCAVEGNGSVY